MEVAILIKEWGTDPFACSLQVNLDLPHHGGDDGMVFLVVMDTHLEGENSRDGERGQEMVRLRPSAGKKGRTKC